MLEERVSSFVVISLLRPVGERIMIWNGEGGVDFASGGFPILSLCSCA